MVAFILRVFVVGAFFSFASPLKAQKYRDDLANQIRDSLCPGKKNSSFENLWSFGVWDGSVQGGVGTFANTDEVRNFIKNKAHLNFHGGYSFFSCGNNKYWYLTTPSQAPFTVTNNVLKLPMISLKKDCRSVALEFAPLSNDNIRSLDLKDGRVSLEALEKGSLTVRCLPRQPHWLGPVVWALIPWKINPKDHMPYEQLVSDSGGGSVFVGWLNKIREQRGLPVLTRDKNYLDLQAVQLSQNNSYLHDQRLNLNTRSSFTGGFELVGDNKVMGSSLLQMVRLLWLSPSHRRLMLMKDTSHLGLHIKKVKEQVLLVLLFARKKGFSK